MSHKEDNIEVEHHEGQLLFKTLASELKKRSPNEARLQLLVPQAVRQRVDINETLPDVNEGVKGEKVKMRYIMKEVVSTSSLIDELSPTTDGDISSTDACGSADDSDGMGSHDDGDTESEKAPKLPLNALQQAAYIGHRPSIKVLLENNAEIDRKVDAQGYEFSNLTAIEIAEQRGHHKSAKLIKDYAFYRACDSGDGTFDVEVEEEMRSCGYATTRGSGYMSDTLSVATDNTANSHIGTPTIDYAESTTSPASETPMTGTRYHSSSEVLVDGVIECGSGGGENPIVGVGTADGYKRPTEDRVVLASVKAHVDLYCVFDGHGGRHYADFVAKQLPARIKEGVRRVEETMKKENPSSKPSPEMYAQVLAESFQEVDQKLLKHSSHMSLLKVGGCTAVAALITPDHVIVANVGDSPCVIFDAATASVLRETVDHTPLNEVEAQRIASKGGRTAVSEDTRDLRLVSDTASISITRAFGQVGFKQNEEVEEHVVCATPQLYIWSRAELMHEAEAAMAADRDNGIDADGQIANGIISRNDGIVVSEGHLQTSDNGETSGEGISSNDTEPVMRTHFDLVQAEGVRPLRPRLVLALYSDSFTEALCDLPGSEKDENTYRPRQVIKNCLSNETVMVLFSEVLRSNSFNCAVSAEKLAAKQVKKFLFNGQYYGDNTSLILVDLENAQGGQGATREPPLNSSLASENLDH